MAKVELYFKVQTPFLNLRAAQREVGDRVAEAWSGDPPAMEPLVRMLLAADRYAAAGLRAECLRRLAARFDRAGLGPEEGAGAALAGAGRRPRLPLRDRRVFDAFLAAVAPTACHRPRPQPLLPGPRWHAVCACRHFCNSSIVADAGTHALADRARWQHMPGRRSAQAQACFAAAACRCSQQ